MNTPAVLVVFVAVSGCGSVRSVGFAMGELRGQLQLAP